MTLQNDKNHATSMSYKNHTVFHSEVNFPEQFVPNHTLILVAKQTLCSHKRLPTQVLVQINSRSQHQSQLQPCGF